MIKELKGITWDHSRAFPPLVAVSQRYGELNQGVEIRWEKRTLDEFGHKPINQLTEEYDLIIIDHPWAGYCFEYDLVFDLYELIDKEPLSDLRDNSLGLSFESYSFEDKLLALPIDVATLTSSWRPDLLKKMGVSLPETLQEVITLADRKIVVMPGFKADLFLNWLMLTFALNGHPFEGREMIANKEEAIEAACLLKRLAEPMPKEIINLNPIQIAEMMIRTDRFIYCPFSYSYSNYARPSFSNNILRYGNLVLLRGQSLRGILGGTGIAISKRCKELDIAVDFSLFVSNSEVQKGIYIYSGGQPARKEAWAAEDLQVLTGLFFRDSFRSHQNAILRPRYNGYVELQDRLGIPLQEFVFGEISESKLWNRINAEYRKNPTPIP